MLVYILSIDDNYILSAKDIIDELARHLTDASIRAVVLPPQESLRSGLDYLEHDRRCDVVFLDIVKIVDSEVELNEAINRIHAVRPGLPVFVLSESQISTYQLAAYEAGIVTFIWKTSLPLTSGTRQDAAAAKAKWSEFARQVRESIVSYGEVKADLYLPPISGVMTKQGRIDEQGSGIVREQAEFLYMLQFLDGPGNLKGPRDLFPPILQRSLSPSGEIYRYQMPRYTMPTFKSWLFELRESLSGHAQAREALFRVLRRISDELYVWDREGDPKVLEHYPRRWLFGRYAERVKETRFRVQELRKNAAVEHQPDLDMLARCLDANEIVVGETTLTSASNIIAQIEEDQELRKRLKPPYLCLTHGDLHFDNILLRFSKDNTIHFKLVDPRGADGGRGVLDEAYDLGKLFHSCSGLYDFFFFREGSLLTYRSLGAPGDSTPPAFKPLDFVEDVATLITSGGSKDSLSASEMPLQWGTTLEIYQKLAGDLTEFIMSRSKTLTDPNLLLRAKFHEAVHFCTMLPFHLNKSVGRTLALHIRGTELMNAFWRSYEAGTL